MTGTPVGSRTGDRRTDGQTDRQTDGNVGNIYGLCCEDNSFDVTTSASRFDNVMINHEMSPKVTMLLETFLVIFRDWVFSMIKPHGLS